MESVSLHRGYRLDTGQGCLFQKLLIVAEKPVMPASIRVTGVICWLFDQKRFASIKTTLESFILLGCKLVQVFRGNFCLEWACRCNEPSLIRTPVGAFGATGRKP